MTRHPATITAYIEGCSSCGQDHADMAFTRLDTPPVIQGRAYPYGGQCPVTGQMIYLTGETVLVHNQLLPDPCQTCPDDVHCHACPHDDGEYPFVGGGEQ